MLLFDVVLSGYGIEFIFFSIAQGLACKEQSQGRIFSMVNLVVIKNAFSVCASMLSKSSGIYIKIILLYEKYRRPDAWYDEDDYKSCGESFCAFAYSFILIFGRAESEILDTYIRRKHDECAVDDEQV